MPKSVDLTGQIFGRLTVLEKSGKVGGNITWECSCECGTIVTTPNTYSLRAGKTLSCGCLRTEGATANLPNKRLHGESKARLYQCWVGMKKRLKKYTCDCEPSWNEYEPFRDWSLLNGYNDSLMLCRGTKENPDCGDYKPGNCRWSTAAENQQDTSDTRAKKVFSFINPEGELISFRNLKSFCKKQGLDVRGMQRVNKGERKTHKGFTTP